MNKIMYTVDPPIVDPPTVDPPTVDPPIVDTLKQGQPFYKGQLEIPKYFLPIPYISPYPLHFSLYLNILR